MTRTTRRSTSLPLLLALALAASACGGGSGTDENSDDATSETTVANETVANGAEPAEDDGQPENTEEPAVDEPADDEPAAPAASDPELLAALSGWIGENYSYTSDTNETDCIAQTFTDGVGSDRLTEAGITVATPDPSAADLTDAEGDMFVDAIFNCIDMRQALVDDLAGGDVSEEEAQCVVNAMGMDIVRDGTKIGLLNPEELDTTEYVEIIEQAGLDCGLDVNS